MLSSRGRIILIKHLLSSIPLHLLSVYNVPGAVLDKNNRSMANFVWSHNEGNHRRHWISWEAVFSTYEEGGLGVRKFSDIMKAMRMKSALRINTSNSLWDEFMKARFGNIVDSKEHIKGPARWKKSQEAWLVVKEKISWNI